jgi:hypothetical protein
MAVVDDAVQQRVGEVSKSISCMFASFRQAIHASTMTPRWDHHPRQIDRVRHQRGQPRGPPDQ